MTNGFRSNLKMASSNFTLLSLALVSPEETRKYRLESSVAE